MTAEVIHTVFVSSTYEDLREERAELQKAILKLHCLPIGMELFPSADEETWEFIKRQMAGADYYALIVGGRYGSTRPDGTSFTEMEYNYAREIGKPILAFVHADTNKIAFEKSEPDPAKRERLKAFLARVKQSPVNAYSNSHELATQFIASFVDLRERNPATGYIRADQAPNYKTYAEALEENARLRAEIASIKIVTTEKFRGADDEVLLRARVGPKGTPPDTWNVKEVRTTYGCIFKFLADQIIEGRRTSRPLAFLLLKSVVGPTNSTTDYGYEDGDQFGRLRQRLFGAELVRFEPDPNLEREVWRLTDFGQRQYGVFLSDPASLPPP